jgi:hypothetical protein
VNDEIPSVGEVIGKALRFAWWVGYLILVACAVVFLFGGCAPEGGSGKAHSQQQTEPDEAKPGPKPKPQDKKKPVVPAEFRSERAKRIDQAFLDYRAGMAKGWREAAAQQPPAKSWDEAYARVKRNNFAEREAAFAPFAEDLDALTTGKDFSPELFREIAERVASALEE